MKVLMVCNSVYQVMVATQLRIRCMASDEVDVVVSDHLSGGANIAERLEQTGAFHKVIHVKNRKYVVRQGSRWAALRRVVNRVRETVKNYRISRAIVRNEGGYDLLCVSNISIFTIVLYHMLQKSGCRLRVFEDGFATYCRSFQRSDGASVVSRALVKGGMLGCAEVLYLFNPVLLEWEFGGQVVSIPKFSRADKHLREVLNTAFGYSEADDYTAHKCLFMEESFAADGYKVNDVELVAAITHTMGKEEVMVKLHPRNLVNRWAPMGVATNKNFGIPWELILLNQDISGVTLVTISSSSVLTPFLIFGEEVRSISLLGMLTERPGAMAGELGAFMEKIYAEYPERFIAPKSMAEFINALTPNSKL